MDRDKESDEERSFAPTATPSLECTLLLPLSLEIGSKSILSDLVKSKVGCFEDDAADTLPDKLGGDVLGASNISIVFSND